MAKKPANDRRRKVDELKKRQQRADRRGTIIAITLAALLGAGLIGGAVYSTRDRGSDKEIDGIGVAFDAAGCGEVYTEDEKESANDHVPTGQTVTYDHTPPASGPHWDPSQLVPANRKFEGRESTYQPEQYVHNLEHGYTVVWYDEDLPDAELELLEELSRTSKLRFKFLVAPWTRGKFEGEANVAMTSWARQQSCTSVSGEAIRRFYDEYGVDGDKNVAPERNAA